MRDHDHAARERRAVCLSQAPEGCDRTGEQLMPRTVGVPRRDVAEQVVLVAA
jgi:hypothetical protein